MNEKALLAAIIRSGKLASNDQVKGLLSKLNFLESTHSCFRTFRLCRRAAFRYSSLYPTILSAAAPAATLMSLNTPASNTLRAPRRFRIAGTPSRISR